MQLNILRTNEFSGNCALNNWNKTHTNILKGKESVVINEILYKKISIVQINIKELYAIWVAQNFSIFFPSRFTSREIILPKRNK